MPKTFYDLTVEENCHFPSPVTNRMIPEATLKELQPCASLETPQDLGSGFSLNSWTLPHPWTRVTLGSFPAAEPALGCVVALLHVRKALSWQQTAGTSWRLR